MIVTGYQTLEDKDNNDEIETDGPFPCNRGNAWLGFGCYFWDSNIFWAHDWGKKSYESRRLKYVIGRCEITLGDSCYDLVGSVAHLLDFEQVFEVLKESPKFKGKTLIVANVIEYLKRKDIFKFKSIRAADVPNNTKKASFGGKWGESMVVNPRVQICVIEVQDIILPPFKVIYP